MRSENHWIRARVCPFAIATFCVLLLATTAAAQYKQINLVSDHPGKASHVDANLKNPWGLAFFPDGSFWVTDNDTGVSTVYGPFGRIVPLVVTIPTAPSMPFGPVGTPAGMVANATSDFVISQGARSAPAEFIFATEDGTISGWNPEVNATRAILVVDNSSTGALYTGLASGSNSNGNFIYAADAVNNRIDVFNGKFEHVSSFTDPQPPAGLGVYGIQNLGQRLFVTLASPVSFSGGAVDIFDTNGQLLQRLTSNDPSGPLQGAWGMVIAPRNFGTFSDDLLVGNVDDGKISAFDPQTGAFLGQLTDTKGNIISNPGLWGLAFGSGQTDANGKAEQLFFAAGVNNYLDGIFGMLVVSKGKDAPEEMP